MYRIGMIGLGRMGMPIAHNLMERGFQIVGYRRHGSPELAAAGGTVVGSAAEVAAGADVLLSIVPDESAVQEVVCGEAGTLTALRAGTIHIEMSTIDVEHKGRIRDAVRGKGGDLLDCPISGSPEMVAPRLATTFASGDPASIDMVRHVLDAVSGPWVYTGPFGTGAHMKYIANMLLAVHTVAAAEALALARRILEQIEGYATRAGLSASVFTAAKEVFDKALADGWGDLDIACVHDQVSGVSALDPPS